MSAYAYIEDNQVVIGNDYIERRFSTKDNRLTTTEIINKRDGGKTVEFKNYSAEFVIAFKVKKLMFSSTEFLSSNNLILENVNVFKRRVEFVFKRCSYNGAKITFIESIEINDDDHYMHKYIEMVVAPEEQHLITVDYIDCEHILIGNNEKTWTIGDIEPAYLTSYHSALGQPVYVDSLFFGSEFPLAENNIQNDTLFIRYFSGKRFDMLNLNCGHTFKTWNTVVGSARSSDHQVIRDDFLSYIRDISRKIKPRFQYNSWYDHMHDITNENIMGSFKEIEDNLSKTMVPPLDSYVVDDGFVDWTADFWEFNSKFPNELYPAASIAKKFSSEFGLWNGPRGGYDYIKTPTFGKNMEKAGKGGYNRAAKDVCVSSSEYIKNVTEYYLENDRKFDINYWKLDGFLLRACPSKKHGHMTGGYNEMYQYTEMWENWINIFKKLRITRESVGKDLWINQTSYCNASPWFLQWADSLWIQNSADIGFVDKDDNGENLSDRDVDRVLTYRDGRYYDFSITRDYQFPHEFIYNHDPIYGNTAKIEMNDEEFRRYMLMMTTRGTAFWELYYSYNMFNKAKWRINADALRFVRNDYDILKTSQFIGGSPSNGDIYGYSAWADGAGIVSLRNPSNDKKSFTITLDRLIGVPENTDNLQRAFIYPYEKPMDEKLYNYGDKIAVELAPCEAVIMKFSSREEKVANLVYGRFEASNEIILHFDDRIYTDVNCISCDRKIDSIQLLEDYSTLKIILQNPADSIFISMTVKNAFGKTKDIEYKGKYYPDLICDDNNIPGLRDITVQFTVKNAENDTLISIDDIFNVSISEGYGAIRFGKKASRGNIPVKSGDRLTVVFEPNSLAKLYVNGELSSSAYNNELAFGNTNYELNVQDNASDVKVLLKALSFKEIGD
ncbi:MAG: hypothetical protein IKC45_08285 [Clostridia bacterium]|nr:hypothetical protein [Clostridia bacterium]